MRPASGLTRRSHEISFSSLFLGIRFATLHVPQLFPDNVDSFSSLFLGIRFATDWLECLPPEGFELSVPFSSGFALRPECDDPDPDSKDCRFQFPFPRDSLCDSSQKYIIIQGTGLSVPFSSGFALRLSNWIPCACIAPCLSVPFSSGFALRQLSICLSQKIYNSPFSSLFLGIRFATLFHKLRFFLRVLLSVPFSSGFALRQGTITTIKIETEDFQFPFPRDSLCDRYPPIFRNFNGNFQFPFPRDSLCDIPISRPMIFLFVLSVPFSSGFALRLFRKMRMLKKCLGFQFPFPRDSLCDESFRQWALFSSFPFQFPFPRDSLCDSNRCAVTAPGQALLSVPFSSGFALRRSHSFHRRL